MAHPYTTRAKVITQSRNPERVSRLADANGDGQEDSGVIAGSIETACRIVDARLGRRWSVPFDADPSTPALIAEITECLTLWDLYSRAEPEGADAKFWFARADGLLSGILDGTFFLDATVRAADSTSRRGPVLWSGRALFVAGTSDDEGSDPDGTATDNGRGI
jgi:phage gp36-like protein